MFRISVAALALLALMTGPASAQFGSIVTKLWGASRYDQFGHCVADIGDVTGDGVTDFAVGAPNGGPDNFPWGLVHVYDGVTFAELFYSPIAGLAVGDQFGWDIAGIGSNAGGIEVGGTAAPDFIVGAPGVGAARGYVQARDGGNGALLWTAQLGAAQQLSGAGYSVASLGTSIPNISNGINEVVVGAPRSGNAAQPHGYLYVLNGSSGAIIGSAVGSLDDHLGSSVDGYIDVDHDPIAVGYPEVLAGAPGALDEARIYGWSGSTLIPLRAVTNPQVAGYGSAVRRAGDVNGNASTEEFVVGGLVGGNANEVDIYTLQWPGQATLLATFSRIVPPNPWVLPVPLSYGCALDAGSDRNHDGVPDLLIGACGRLSGGGGLSFASGVDLYFMPPTFGPASATFWDANGAWDDFGRSVAFIATTAFGGGLIAVGSPQEVLGGFVTGSVTIYQ